MCGRCKADRAQHGGDRVELVAALTEGGLAPSYALIENALKAVRIPVNVMIRPHAKSFLIFNRGHKSNEEGYSNR